MTNLIEAIRAHATANYAKGGWDILTECWSDDDIANAIGGATTQKSAIANVRKALKTLDDHRAEVRSEIDVEKPAKKARAPKAPKADKPKTPKAEKIPRVVKLEDRVIQAPATDLKFVKALTQGSKKHLMAEALLTGATMDELVAILGWSKDVVSSAFRYDMKMSGLGVRREAGKYFLILPEGLKALPIKTVDMSRADALVAACK